jgi:hypothetical protein
VQALREGMALVRALGNVIRPRAQHMRRGQLGQRIKQTMLYFIFLKPTIVCLHPYLQ